MSAPDPRRARLGLALIVAGILAIVGGVLVVLESANGPGLGPTKFEERRSYNQTKEAVHSSPLGFVIALAGLGVAIVGGRLRRREDADE